MIPAPCPFCGLAWNPPSEGEQPRPTLAFWDGYENPWQDPDDAYGIAVYCPHCKAKGPEVSGVPAGSLTDEAVRLWNERVA